MIATVDDLCDRGNTLTIKWTPSHEGVEGNEQADGAGRLAGEGGGERAGPDYLREASLAHLMRETTEARAEATSAWIRDRVGWRHRYRPPPEGKAPKGTSEGKKGAGRTVLPAIFRTCCDGRAPKASRPGPRGSILEFLEDTRVGRMPGRILMAGGPDVEEDELDEVELLGPEEGGEGTEISESEEEGGPGPPL